VDGIGTAATLNGPHALAVDPSGTYLLVSENAVSKIRKVILATGVTSTLVGSTGAGYLDGPAATTAKISSPKGLTFSPDGMVVYLADTTQQTRPCHWPHDSPRE
jgi:DNA-binding beta-propeller fold protein YncE